MALNGTSVLIYANTGTQGSPVWTQAGAQRDCKLAEDVAVIDTSSKDAPQRTVIGGRYSSQFTLQQVYAPADAAYQALITNFRNRALCQVQVYEVGVLTAQGSCLITKMDRDFPDQKEALCTMTFDLSGAWTLFGVL